MMNTVTIHAPKAKPLTFADIPPGPFVFHGTACVKLNSHAITDDSRRAARVRDGVLFRCLPDEDVTLPDAPPPQDDTVAYGDLGRGEMLEFADHSPGDVWIKGRTDAGSVLCLNPATGRIMSMPESARVRRVHSVTITREESK